MGNLTIVVGIKCVNGALIATDTQSEFGRGVSVKRLNANKIHYFDCFSVAGAGTVAHIEKAADALKQGIATAIKGKGEHLAESECINTIERTITAVYKEYNVDRSRFLDDPRELNFFQPILIFGGMVSTASGKKTCLSIVHSAGLVEPIHDYATAGSGAAYAELILKNYYSPNLQLKQAIPMAVYTINEVKQIDPGCGGDTRVAIIEDGANPKELSEKDVDDVTHKFQEPLDLIWKRLIGRVLRGEVDVGRLKKI